MKLSKTEETLATAAAKAGMDETTPGRGHENGDVEQSHHRFKRAVDQELLLCGSRDFNWVRLFLDDGQIL